MSFDCSRPVIENPFELGLIDHQTSDTFDQSCQRIHKNKRLDLGWNITLDVNTNGTTTFCFNKKSLLNCANVLIHGCIDGFMAGFATLSTQYYEFENATLSEGDCSKEIKTIWDNENVWKLHYVWCRLQ